MVLVLVQQLRPEVEVLLRPQVQTDPEPHRAVVGEDAVGEVLRLALDGQAVDVLRCAWRDAAYKRQSRTEPMADGRRSQSRSRRTDE